MLKQFLKTILPVAALGIAFAVSACGNGLAVLVNGGDGVPLANLDMSGAAPTRLVLASPDTVVISDGKALAITVSGDAAAVEALRFTLRDSTLGILREKGSEAKGTATLNITMPPAREFVLAGSGQIRAPTMVGNAEINVAGSGNVAIARMSASKLNINVMGSGTLETAGTAERLEFNVAGPGRLAGRRLKVARAEINIAGSGGGAIASDGKVTANIAGSGEVTVYGRADCKISAVGSGKLSCRNADAAWDDAAPGAARAAAPPKTSAAAKAPPDL